MFPSLDRRWRQRNPQEASPQKNSKQRSLATRDLYVLNRFWFGGAGVFFFLQGKTLVAILAAFLNALSGKVWMLKVVWVAVFFEDVKNVRM